MTDEYSLYSYESPLTRERWSQPQLVQVLESTSTLQKTASSNKYLKYIPWFLALTLLSTAVSIGVLTWNTYIINKYTDVGTMGNVESLASVEPTDDIRVKGDIILQGSKRDKGDTEVQGLELRGKQGLTGKNELIRPLESPRQNGESRNGSMDRHISQTTGDESGERRDASGKED